MYNLTIYLNLRACFLLYIITGVMAVCNRESHLYITAPKMMEALSGSCLQIPCSFTPNESQEKFDQRREIFGVWINSSAKVSKNPNNVVFNSSKPVNLYEIRLIGNLTQKNCTTVFNNLHRNPTNEYFFRIENGPFKATAACNPIQITVQDSAWSPTVEIPADLKEEESVTVTCSALTPCPQYPPELTWNLSKYSQRQIEENTNGSFTTKIQKNITLSDSDDGFTINCSVRYPVNKGENVKTAETQQTLSVSHSPKNTSVSISPSGLVSVGSWVNLTCSSRAKPPVSSFSWFRISKDGDIKVADGDFYSFNVTENAEYRCTATNRMGNQTSEVIVLRIKGSNK
ncbi:B-cell receptor CD22-like [Oryzias latipes]